MASSKKDSSHWSSWQQVLGVSAGGLACHHHRSLSELVSHLLSSLILLGRVRRQHVALCLSLAVRSSRHSLIVRNFYCRIRLFTSPSSNYDTHYSHLLPALTTWHSLATHGPILWHSPATHGSIVTLTGYPQFYCDTCWLPTVLLWHSLAVQSSSSSSYPSSQSILPSHRKDTGTHWGLDLQGKGASALEHGLLPVKTKTKKYKQTDKSNSYSKCNKPFSVNDECRGVRREAGRTYPSTSVAQQISEMPMSDYAHFRMKPIFTSPLLQTACLVTFGWHDSCTVDAANRGNA